MNSTLSHVLSGEHRWSTHGTTTFKSDSQLMYNKVFILQKIVGYYLSGFHLLDNRYYVIIFLVRILWQRFQTSSSKTHFRFLRFWIYISYYVLKVLEKILNDP